MALNKFTHMMLLPSSNPPRNPYLLDRLIPRNWRTGDEFGALPRPLDGTCFWPFEVAPYFEKLTRRRSDQKGRDKQEPNKDK